MRLTRRTMVAATLAAAAAPGRGAGMDEDLRLKPDREAMIPVPGGRVYVRVNGDLAGPRPPIVFIHGGPGSAHWYFLNATALAGERAVILYDQLDSGRSEGPDDPANWTVARFVDELEAVRTGLGIARWHALGASWGGTILLEHAARRPASLASAIIQSPLVVTREWIRDAQALRDAMPAETRRLLELCETRGAAPEAECNAARDAFYARHVHLRPPTPEIAAYRAALPRSFNPKIYNHLWGWAEFSATGTMRDYDGSALLARLDGPRTLFVAGEHDEARPATVARYAARAGAGFATVPDAAHTIMNDNPAAYLALLRPWLARHDG
jgi:L-proline amide hydrolase